ncbi:MAG TPA: hypothetical protein VN613_03605 [Gemmatimonadaceae bacterium]|nr:hypothetical protein [Gemmatimonadaceae bacterium]
MIRRLASAALLVAGVLITLGAYGHGLMGRKHIDVELDKFAIAPNVYTMLYVVWYFVSGCMLLFGVTVIAAWVQERKGRTALLPVAGMIGSLYLATGVGGMIYRNGDPFMAVFIVEGGTLLCAALVLRRRTGADG